MWWLLLLIFFIGLIAFFALGAKLTKSIEEGIKKKLETLENFTPSNMYLGPDPIEGRGIAYDEKREKICLISNQGNSLKVVEARSIISSEIIEDGISIEKTDRDSQLTGVVVGGLLLGGAGAVIGGLSGKKQVDQIVNKIILRLTIDDMTNPIYDITFLEEKTKKNNYTYKTAMQEAQYWHGIMNILMNRANAKNKVMTANVTHKTSVNSVADEIKKLIELKRQGILTDEEFNAQKAKLLK